MAIAEGLLLLDKPKGITSREAVQKVKHIIGIGKAGNSGTLDPNATGLLVICLGKATKIMPALQGLDKEYLAQIHFHRGISNEEMENLIRKFSKKIVQLPPVKSAVARKPRMREIYSMEIVGKEGKDFTLKIRCEAGTYIRKLASDMGIEVGGAHLKELRRTMIGEFRIENACKIEELERTSGEELKKIILPIESGVEHLKKIILKSGCEEKVITGRPILTSYASCCDKDLSKGELAAVFSSGKELIALARFLGEAGKIAYIDRVIKTK